MLGACSSPQSTAGSVCDKSHRTELLNVVLYDSLDTWDRTPAFTITNGFAAWIQVTKDDQADRLFGSLGDAAEVFPIPSGTTPNVVVESNGFLDPKDPRVAIKKAFTWQKLPVEPGSWQLYSFGLVGMEVVACPAG